MFKSLLLVAVAVCSTVLTACNAQSYSACCEPAAVATVSTEDAKSSDPAPASRPAPAAEADPALPGSEGESLPGDAEKREATPLSVEPGVRPSTIVYPPNRKNWIDKRERQGNVLRVGVSSGAHSLPRDCVEALNAEMQRTVNDYVAEHLGAGDASRLVHYDLSDQYTRDSLVKEKYEEQVEFSIGKMYQHHALLVFDDAFNKKIEKRWAEIKATSRLLQTGLFGGAVLGFLGLAFGYLKLDTATRGYYTGRLRFGAVAAILGLAAAGVCLARWIPWM